MKYLLMCVQRRFVASVTSTDKELTRICLCILAGVHLIEHLCRSSVLRQPILLFGNACLTVGFRRLSVRSLVSLVDECLLGAARVR